MPKLPLKGFRIQMDRRPDVTIILLPGYSIFYTVGVRGHCIYNSLWRRDHQGLDRLCAVPQDMDGQLCIDQVCVNSACIYDKLHTMGHPNLVTCAVVGLII